MSMLWGAPLAFGLFDTSIVGGLEPLLEVLGRTKFLAAARHDQATTHCWMLTALPCVADTISLPALEIQVCALQQVLNHNLYNNMLGSWYSPGTLDEEPGGVLVGSLK